MNAPSGQKPTSFATLAMFASRTAVGTAIVTAVGVILVGAWYGRELILLVFAGLLLAVYLRALSHVITRYTRISCYWSTWLVIVILLAAITGIAAWLLPHLIRQFSAMYEDLAASVDQIRSYLSSHPRAQETYNWILKRAEPSPRSSSILGVSQSLFSTFVGAATAVILVAFITIYLALQAETYRSKLMSYVPPRARARTDSILDAVIRTLRWWFIGKTLSIAVVGLLTWIGLIILGVKLALTLAILAGLLAFIPNFGPIIAVVPAMLVALAQRPVLAVWVAVLYLAVQTMESYIITPLIQRRAVTLMPVVIIVGQVALGMISGALGLALATPIIAVLHVLGQELYLRDILGENPNDPQTQPD